VTAGRLVACAYAASRQAGVLRQECRACGCSPGTAGTEDIRIDWITMEIRRGHWGGQNV
jgi:hypothetical protein